MPLAVPLSHSQIAAAGRLHQRLEQWCQADAALLRLRDSLPDFDADSCLLKAVVVNSLYSTSVLAIAAMARQICAVMACKDLQASGCELVDRIAPLMLDPGEAPRKFISFASKFCHFFVDEERFPIYDGAARSALRMHLGSTRIGSPTDSAYAAFREDLARLRGEAGLACSNREIDRYLWITGMYMKWQKDRKKKDFAMNVELKQVFEQPTTEQDADLHALLPDSVAGAGSCGRASGGRQEGRGQGH